MKPFAPMLAALLLAGYQSVALADTAAGGSATSDASGSSSGSSHAKQARAELQAKSGSNVNGTVNFTERDGVVRMEVKASGLQPNSEHGIHIHEKGDCSAPDATSAGGHFNPGDEPHGHPREMKHHAGDLPNLRADAQGQATATYEAKGITLDQDFRSVLQRAVVIHAEPDDYKTQPAGDSGARIACGVIKKV
jgi:Cu-Zn family superoxide dismutase